MTVLMTTRDPVLAIDPAYAKATALALYDGSEMEAWKVSIWKPVFPRVDGGTVWMKLGPRVVYEDDCFRGSGPKVRLAVGVLLGRLSPQPKDVTGVKSSRWRRDLNIRGADRAAKKDAARQFCRRHGWTIPDDPEADLHEAACMAYWGWCFWPSQPAGLAYAWGGLPRPSRPRRRTSASSKTPTSRSRSRAGRTSGSSARGRGSARRSS